jgi:hypothetical protein
MDVETAFLHGELKETIYMAAPKGTNIPKHQCVKLNKALYGLVQAARQFYLKFADILQQIDFKVSYADPCLFYRTNQNGRIIMIVHVDDCYTIGDPQALKTLEKELNNKGLKLKVSNLASDYLSCDIKIDKENKMAWIGQTTLMKKVIKKFQSIVQKGNFYFKTPGTPKQQIERPEESDQILTSYQQTEYRSGVGTLLQFSNKTRPDLANPVRELAKCMDNATPAAMKELIKVLKFLIDTKGYGLKIQPTLNQNNNNEWHMVIYSDSDWAGDKGNRKSVMGFSIFLQEAPILWRSQSQKTVSLSST